MFACWDCGFESSRGDGCVSLSSDYFVLSGTGLCVGLIARPEESVLSNVVCLVHVMGQAVSRQTVTAVARDRSDAGPCGTCAGSHWKRLLSECLYLHYQYNSALLQLSPTQYNSSIYSFINYRN
jgi:hypothetical protein